MGAGVSGTKITQWAGLCDCQNTNIYVMYTTGAAGCVRKWHKDYPVGGACDGQNMNIYVTYTTGAAGCVRKWHKDYPVGGACDGQNMNIYVMYTTGVAGCVCVSGTRTTQWAGLVMVRI